jgi:tRNA threonylcarbamoyladenosine biosynthesis protein TsaE
MADNLELTTHSPEETQRLGRLLGEAAQPGDVFLLLGPLGAGKTSLTQGIAWGLGVKEHARSPTFVLMTRYQGRIPIHHVDLFRLEDAMEAADIGLEEYLGGDGVCVIEWADRAVELFGDRGLWVNMDYGQTESERVIQVTAKDPRHQILLESVSKQVRA